MIHYVIVLFCFILSISCQQIDDLVECNMKNITQEQIDQMNIDEQEKLVKKFLFCFFLLFI